MDTSIAKEESLKENACEVSLQLRWQVGSNWTTFFKDDDLYFLGETIGLK